MPPNPNIYGPTICALFLLSLTWVSFGLDGLSNNLLLISFYCMLVPSLFFTYGAYIEQQVVKKQINRVVENIKSTADDLNFDIPPVNIPPGSKNDDDNVKNNNEKIIQQAFTVMTPIFFVGIFLSYLCWIYSKKRISYKFILIANLILLFLIAIIEMLFFGLITLNYRSLDSNMISRTTLTTIGHKLEGN